MTPHKDDDKSGISVLLDKIKDVKIAMLTTIDQDGALHSRPMATLKAEEDGELWFFTGASSPKVAEVKDDQRVNLSYADPGDTLFVSVSGTAQLVRDPAKAKELWSPLMKAWFPEGLDDPNLGLLRVKIEKAEYWDGPSSKMVQLAGFLKAIVTGKRYDQGENEKVELATPSGSRGAGH
jgi:general stress protein 26